MILMMYKGEEEGRLMCPFTAHPNKPFAERIHCVKFSLGITLLHVLHPIHVRAVS